jgi:hypothetical protein
MLDDNRPLGEQLRQAAAEARDHRDRVLKAAELLPFWEQVPLRETADKLMAFSTELQEIAEKLSAGEGEGSAETEPSPPELLIRIEDALDRYEAALAELGGIADELSEDAEEEAPEPIH